MTQAHPSSETKRSRYRLVDDELIDLLKNDPEARKYWLFLEPHPDFEGRWKVQGFSQAFFFDMQDMIGSYKVVAPATLSEFLTTSEELGYEVAFFRDPFEILGPYERLNEDPDVEINSTLDHTRKGMFDFQIRGYNFLKELEGGVALWSTGTGKSVLTAALVKHHHSTKDVIFVIPKSHNKINMQRSLDRLVDLPSTVIDGDKKKRRRLYAEVLAKAEAGEHPIVILNYEKFRYDKDELALFFEGTKVFIVWDEMPVKLKNRDTLLYHAVCECLYTLNPPAVSVMKRRPKEVKQIMLSATPIENNPEDFFNCVRLMDPTVFGTVAEFHDEYVASFSHFNDYKPDKWRNLERMGLRAEHIVHQVDKENDPAIAALFPDVLPETRYVDWDPAARRVYDLMTKEAAKLDLEEANILAIIGVLQMLCSAPSMITNSATIRDAYDAAVEQWVEQGGKEPDKEGSEIAQMLVERIDPTLLKDDQHLKLAALRELLTDTHPDEKVVLFSAFNEGLMPILEAKLTDWGVNYVRYEGTDKQRQAAEDAFQSDPDVQVFLSSDKGSDSLSLNAGSVVIHYDLPWKWSTYTQRENRIHRIDSEFDTVRFYTLVMADSIEDRKIEIIKNKFGYHDQVFNGAIADQAASARMTREDLEFVLFG